MNLRRIIKEFKKGSVTVVGMRGTGKDMLFANVIARRRQPYISNTDYNCKNSPYLPLRFDKLNVKNNYKNFIENDIVPYDYPYPQNADIYISDCGIYLPSQYCSQLDKAYPEFPVFFALSRHIANCSVHTNCQDLSRIWTKLQEQSDSYILCNSCYYFNIPILRKFKLFRDLVFQRVTIYDKYQSCADRVKSFKPVLIPLFAKAELKASLRQVNEEAKRRYNEQYGLVKSRLLIYRNKSKYDTRLFKGVLCGEK